VLDEHLVYCFVFEAGVDGFAAEVGEGGEGFAECLVGAVLFGDEFERAVSDVWDAGGEFADGAVPVFLVRLAVFEKGAEDIDELYGFGDFPVEFDAVVLDEQGVGGGLEEDVGAG